MLEALPATLRKITTSAVDSTVLVSNGLEGSTFQDLNREVLSGHQEILEGKVTSLRKARKEFGLDY